MVVGHDGKEAQPAIPVLDDFVAPLNKMQSRIGNKILDDRRCQYLAGRSEGGDPLGNVERAARDRIIPNPDFSGMHADLKIACDSLVYIPHRPPPAPRPPR